MIDKNELLKHINALYSSDGQGEQKNITPNSLTLGVVVDVDDCILDHEHVELVVEKLFDFELIILVVVGAVVVAEVSLVVLVDSSYHQTLTSIHQDSNLPKDFVVVVEMKLPDCFVLVVGQ